MSKHGSTRPAAAKPASLDIARAAFQTMRPRYLALATSDLVAVNTDVPAAVSIVLGALPHLRALRSQIVEELPKFPVHYLDELETIALAAWFAHLRTLPANDRPDAVATLLAEATPLRKGLLVAAVALADRGLLSQATVDQIQSGQGHLDTANDLVALAALFHEAWPRVQGKTAVTEEEIARAASLGPQLIAALGMRDNPLPGANEDLADLRVRAFSLLVRAYDECRHASRYLRRHEPDPDALTPSIYARNTRVRRAAREEPEGPSEPSKPQPA
jgi:hypothetical protein